MQKPNLLYVSTAAAITVIVFVSGYYLIRSGQPSAEVAAQEEANRPYIDVADFAPGDAKVLLLKGRPIIVWRRDKADMALAELQNTPSHWTNDLSKILGKLEPVFADDANLTLDGEWFIALGEFPNSSPYIPLLRTGDFEGFFDMHWASHYDLSGRFRSGVRSANLTIVSAEYANDGQHIRLDLRERHGRGY